MLSIKNITTIIALALCLVSLAGAEEGKAREVKLELIWEKNFDFLPSFEERKSLPITIRGDEVIFDEAEVTAKEAKELGFKGYEDFGEDEKVKIPYPKVMIGRSDIMFLGFKGNIVKKYPLGEWAEVGFSKNKQFIGILGLGKSQKDRIFSMLDSEGNILWKTDITRVGYTLPHISPNGEYVIAEGDPSYDLCDYYPSIWDKNGLVKGLFEEGTRAELKDIDFTADGEYFVIAYESAAVETTSQKIKTRTGEELPYYKLLKYTWVSLFTKTGDVVWKQKLSGLSRGVSISKTGDYVAVLTQSSPGDKCNTLSLFNKKGKLKWRKNILLGNGEIIFSNDGKNLAVISGWGGFYILQTGTGIVLAVYNKYDPEKDRSPNFIYRKLVVDDAADLFLIGGFTPRDAEANQYPIDFLYIIDAKGELVDKYVFERHTLSGPKASAIPNLKVDNKKILLLDRLNAKIIYIGIEELDN